MQTLDPYNLPDKRVEAFKYTDLSKLLVRFGGHVDDTCHMPVVQGTASIDGQAITVTGMDAVIIDDIALNDTQWINRAFTINIADNAHCTYIRLITGAGALTDTIQMNIGARANVTVLHAHVDQAVARTTMAMNIQEQAQAYIYGVQMLRPGAHGDLTTTLNHVAPDAVSVQRVRNVVAGGARGVYQGTIHVTPNGQKTDATQHSKSILLAPTAEMNTKPELQIFADDVACAHGATTGALDPEQMFYAMARGLNADQARGLLLRAFLTADLPQLPGDFRVQIENLVDAAMAGGIS